jgi:subtilase family serine protease
LISGFFSEERSKYISMPPLRKLFLILAGTLLCYSASIAQDSAPAVRIVDRIDENNLVTLAGNTHPMARAQFDRGRVSPDLPLDGLLLVLQRSPQQQAEFDKFVASQSDPSSPNYHQWLEPEEVGERFGPALSDIDAIENWLRGHGLAVGQVSKDRMTIQFGGSASQVESAFHTQIHSLDVKGVQHFANMSNPRIPAALSAVVLGPKALHNFQPHPLHKLGGKVAFDRAKGGWKHVQDENASADSASAAKPRPLFTVNDPTDGLIEDVTPYDFAAIYNVTPSWTKGIDGAGQTIAIAGTSEIDASDVATFRSTFGLPPIPSFKQVVANGINPGQCGAIPTGYCSIGDQIENSLDVEWSGAVAKGANIVLVVSGENASGSIDTVYASSDYVVENKTASILNVSYGACELFEGTSGNASYKNLWQTAYTEGIAVFVATGDSGSAACDEGGDANGTPYVAEYGLSVSGVASTPYNIAVGGTDLDWCSATASSCSASPYWSSTNSATTKASALGYIPEVPWNQSCLSAWILPYLQSVAHQLSISTPSDAEEACNLIIYYYESSEDSSLNSLIDTVGGAGGRSSCTTNSTTSSTTQPNPASCSGGYPKPTWQAGVTGIPSSDVRLLPDVSFFASDDFMGSAYLICVSPGNAACTYSDTSESTAQEVGGTSASSPAMAGVMALINQAAGAPQGNPNAELYSLATKQNYGSCSAESVKTSSSCYFNDIDTSTISQPCDWGLNLGDSPNCQVINSYEGTDDMVGTLEGYSAGRGFDLATGLGSLNVSNVVNAWPISTVPAVTLSTTSLTFTGTEKGIASGAQTIILKNTGHGSLVLNGTGQGIKIAGTDASSFTETNTCGASLAIDASCNINVVFKPAATGTLTASLGIADNASGSPQTVNLTGVGTAAVATLSSTALTFPGTAVGGSASSQVNLSNTGTGALSLSGAGLGISIVGTDPKSFAETNNCGTSLGIGKKCTITVTFKPAAPGALTATLSIADNAPGSPQKISLSGEGAGPRVRLSHTSLAFAATEVGAAATQTVTLANSGTSTLTLGGITISGTNPNSFHETNNCGGSVSAGKSCYITVTFKPTKTGSLSADVSISDGLSGSPQKIPLTGTGSGPVVTLSESTLKFPATTLHEAAPKQSFTLTNKGNAKLGKKGAALVSITGTNPLSFSETNNCGTGLAPGAKCTISVTFKPGKAGALSADVTFTDNATPATQQVKLTGTGK